MIYQSFAQLYDQLFDQELYQQWLEYTLTTAHPQAGVNCLELAGGAGRLAVMLAQHGLKVTVADFSTEMLSLANQHATEAGVPVTAVEADMRDLTNFPQYDLVTCYADSLNYLADLTAIKTTFQQVNDHLKADGTFLFDMITPHKTDIEYPGYMYNYEDDEHREAFLWRSYANDDVEHGVIHELTFFNKLPDGNYQRVSETHFERAYDLTSIITQLSVVGFSQISVSRDFGRGDATDDDDRWFFKCQK